MRTCNQDKLRAAYELPDEISDDEVIAAIMSLPEHFADLSITAANVAVVAGTGQQVPGFSGVAMTAGESVYLDPVSQTWKLADATVASGTALKSGVGTLIGIVLNSSPGVGQPITVFIPRKGQPSQITIGATVTLNAFYVVSVNNAGGVCAIADFATPAMWLSLLGVAISATVIEMAPAYAFNTQHA
jgi:hypothetical protein